MGHEGVGKVVGVGKKVKNTKIKDIVVVSWVKKPGKKKYEPLSFKYKNEKINSGGCNTLSQYTLVSDNRFYA